MDRKQGVFSRAEDKNLTKFWSYFIDKKIVSKRILDKTKAHKLQEWINDSYPYACIIITEKSNPYHLAFQQLPILQETTPLSWRQEQVPRSHVSINFYCWSSFKYFFTVVKITLPKIPNLTINTIIRKAAHFRDHRLSQGDQRGWV